MSLFVKLITKHISKPRLSLFFLSNSIVYKFVHKQYFFAWAQLVHLKILKLKAQTLLVYKQTNMDKFFIEPNWNYLWTTWFIYEPYSYLAKG